MYERRPGFFREDSHPGHRVEARVKWFNASKGFGFVTLADGSQDAFLPMAVLRRAGYEDVREGASITCEIGAGAKGPLVTNVLNVDEARRSCRRAQPAGWTAADLGLPRRWRERSNGSRRKKATASFLPTAVARMCSSTSPLCAAAASTLWIRANGSGSKWSTARKASRPIASP